MSDSRKLSLNIDLDVTVDIAFSALDFTVDLAFPALDVNKTKVICADLLDFDCD